MEPESPLGRMVRHLRLRADLTLEQLSEASGVSDRALSDIERGASRGPQHRTVLAILDGLDAPDVDRTRMLRLAREGRRRSKLPPTRPLPPPRMVTDFTGRATELATITAALSGRSGGCSPLVLVTGPPGYGKTSLAVAATARLSSAFPEQLFVDLGGVTDDRPTPDAVVARVLGGLAGGGDPIRGEPGQLRGLLDGRPVLLVLDDAVTESQVRAVLPATAPAAVLVTSRRTLAGLDGAARIHLDRLPREDAVQFLTRTVPADQVAGADLGRLARLCDDVPLALRIAGNRLSSRPGWTVQALTARLAEVDRRLDALTAGDLQLRAAVGASYRRLGPGAQRLFRRLALVDGRTLGTGLACALAEEPLRRTEELLDELVDLGLVRTAAHDRFALHELLQLYGSAELGAQEGPAAREALRAAADDWLLSTAVHAGRWFRPGHRAWERSDREDGVCLESPAAAGTWLTDEAENWSAAIERAARRGDRARVAEVTAALPWFRLGSSRTAGLLAVPA